jgi:hypothetical protein
MSQDRRWREILFDRLQPADKVRELALFATGTSVNSVDDPRQIDI